MQNLDLHQQRMDRSRMEVLGLVESINLAEIRIPEEFSTGLVKCRVDYAEQIESIVFEHYVKRRINSIALISAENVDYAHKYADRSPFQRLLQSTPGYDELILVKNGLLTDTTFTNLAFYDGERWLTPNSPLLKGTRRQSLISRGTLTEADIRPGDLRHFSTLSLINAMLDLGELCLPCDALKVLL